MSTSGSLLRAACASCSLLLCRPLACAEPAPWSMGMPIITYGNFRALPPSAKPSSPCAVYGPDGEGFPALEGAYGWPSKYDPTTLNPTIARQSAAGGFNLVSINDTAAPRTGSSQLQIAEQHGVRAQLRLGDACSPTNQIFRITDTSGRCSYGNWQDSCWPAPGTLDYLNTLIDQFKASPAAYSYALADEPCERPNPGVRFDPAHPLSNAGDACGSKLRLLGAIAAYIRQRDPAHLVYVNLLPPSYGAPELAYSTTNPPAFTSYPSYVAYVADFIDKLHPALLSYDSYPFKTDKNGKHFDDIAFLTDAQTIAQISAQRSIPFMAFVQGMSMNLADQLRVPTAGELAYQANAILAFGAGGIAYFNYWCIGGPACGGLAPPYPTGEPTSVYTALQTINPVFLRLALQLRPLRWMGAYLKGYSTPPPGLSRLPPKPAFDIPAVRDDMTWSARSQGPGPTPTSGPPLRGLLIGYFGTTGTSPAYAFVVNLDYTAPRNIRVTGPGPISGFNATSGAWAAAGHAYADVTLTPGGGALVGLTSTVGAVEPTGH